jgi:hypothetical protein
MPTKPALNFAFTRSVTLDAPISATVILAELADELVRALLADHPHEKTISLLAISVSHLEEHWDVELELPLGLDDEARRPGSKKKAWHVGRPTMPSTGSAIASGGMPSDTDRWHWASLLPFQTSFANSPKRTCDCHQYTVHPKTRALKQTGAAASIVLRESAATKSQRIG